MASEFGNTNYTNDRAYTNSGKQTENRSQKANPSVREFHDYSKQKETSSAAEKKGNHFLFRSLTTAAAAAVAAVTILPAVMGPAIDVRFEYLNATDTVIEYVLSIENAEDEQVSILVMTPNGNTVNEQIAEEDIVTGTVTGLNAGARYEIVVKSDGTTLTSRGVTMATKRTTALRGIETECRCAVDGTFHFTLDFIDENGYWSDFKATLTDDFGNTSSCDFSDAPREEHSLAVEDAGMHGNHAVLRVTCTTTAPDEEGDRTPREFVLVDDLEVSI